MLPPSSTSSSSSKSGRPRKRGGGGGTSVSPNGKQAALNGNGKKPAKGTGVAKGGRQAAIDAVRNSPAQRAISKGFAAGMGVYAPNAGKPTGNNWSGGGGSFKAKPLSHVSATAADNDTRKKSDANRKALAKLKSAKPAADVVSYDGGGGGGGGVNYAPSGDLASAINALAGFKPGKYTGDAKFSGKLEDYIAKYKSMMPKVGYDSLIKNAQGQAATGDKNIQGVYNGLGAYISGMAPQLKANADEAAEGYKASATSATDLINKSYDAARQSVASQLASIGGMEGTNPDPNGTGAAHQAAAGSDIASRLMSSLTKNEADLTTNLAFNNTQGSAAAMQGSEQRADLQKELAKMVAQYRTQQSQENAQNAKEALGMGTSQFNTDRSYAQSEAARQQQAINDQYQRLVDQRNFAADQDNQRYSRSVDERNFDYQQGRDAKADTRAEAEFQLQVDSAAAKAANSAAPKADAMTKNQIANLWKDVYASTLRSTNDEGKARAAANKAAKDLSR